MKITPHVLRKLGFKEVDENNFKRTFRHGDENKEVTCSRSSNKGCCWTVSTYRCSSRQIWHLEYLIEALCIDSFVLGREKVKGIINDVLKPCP